MCKNVMQIRAKRTCEARDRLFKRLLDRIDSSELTKSDLNEIKYTIEEAYIEGGRAELENMKCGNKQ